MGMDRNTVIGFVLIGMLLIGMFYFNSRGNQAFLAEQKRVADSIQKSRPKKDTLAILKDSLTADTVRKLQSAGGFQTYLNQPEQLVTLENEVIKVTFTSKGAQPKVVELKKYKTLDGKTVVLQKGSFNKLSYLINSDDRHTAETSDLTFVPGSTIANADKSQTINFSIKDSTGKEVTHKYTLHPNEYMIDFSIIFAEANKLVTQNSINLLWQTQTEQVEKDISYEKQQTHICQVK